MPGYRPPSLITRRLWAWVEALAQVRPIAHVAQLTGWHWHTLKEIDRLRLEAWHGQFEGGGERRLVMDESALHKGYRWATVVMDAETMRVFGVGEGRSREALRPHGPQAEGVYDLVHVVARFGREVRTGARVPGQRLA